MNDRFQEPTDSRRRRALKQILAIGGLCFAPGLVRAQNKELFSDRPQDLDGPLSQFAKDLAKRAQSLGNRGRYAQTLYEEFEKGDKRARIELYKLAQAGDEDARTIMGWMFDNGVGVTRNSTKAAELFLLASKKVPLAHYNLGVLLLQGRGVARDERAAMGHFNKATRVSAAFMQLAYYALDHEKGNTALHFAEIAAKQKDPAGMYLYGRLLLEKGEAREGQRYVLQAAQANFPAAITSMVAIYEKGLGVSADAGMAAGWWIVDQVLNGGQAQQRSEEAIRRFDLTDGDKAKAIRFSRKWLINRKLAPPFDYTKTLNFETLRVAP